jgi:hypothetical protein
MMVAASLGAVDRLTPSSLLRKLKSVVFANMMLKWMRSSAKSALTLP